MDYSLKNITTAASSHEISHWFYLVCSGFSGKCGKYEATSPFLPAPKCGLHIFKQQVYTSWRGNRPWPWDSLWSPGHKGGCSMIKAMDRRKRDKPRISCPMTLSFHLIFKFQKVTKLLGRYTLCLLPKDSLLIMTWSVDLRYCSETDHSIEAGRNILFCFLTVNKLIEPVKLENLLDQAVIIVSLNAWFSSTIWRPMCFKIWKK